MSSKISAPIDPDKLKAARVRNMLTLRELAAASGIDHNALWLYETGQRSPTLRNIRRVAQALDVEPETLLK